MELLHDGEGHAEHVLNDIAEGDVVGQPDVLTGGQEGVVLDQGGHPHGQAAAQAESRAARCKPKRNLLVALRKEKIRNQFRENRETREAFYLISARKGNAKKSSCNCGSCDYISSWEKRAAVSFMKPREGHWLLPTCTFGVLSMTSSGMGMDVFPRYHSSRTS